MIAVPFDDVLPAGCAAATRRGAAPRAVRDASDVALRRHLDAVARGDAAALSHLYDLTIERCYGLALRITGDAAAAERVVADVYVAVWEGTWRDSPARAGVAAWIAGLTRTRALAEASVAAGDAPDLLRVLEPGHPLYLRLARLEENERRILAAAYFQGLDIAAIAARLGLPLESAKASLRSATEKLR